MDVSQLKQSTTMGAVVSMSAARIHGRSLRSGTDRISGRKSGRQMVFGFTLSKPMSDYSLFTFVRTSIGPTRLSPLFATMREQLMAAGLMSEVFTFVDAPHLIAKTMLSEERDKERQQKIEKLNNEVLSKMAVDKQTQIGCKGKKKFWYGYREHVSVDMQSCLINKVFTPPSNLPDAQGLRHVCPKQETVYANKGH